MSNESTETSFLAGDFISENAVRGVFGRRRRAARTTPTDAAAGQQPANRPLGDSDTSTHEGRKRPLRRWSVAELIARAVPTPPADASHG